MSEQPAPPPADGGELSTPPPAARRKRSRRFRIAGGTAVVVLLLAAGGLVAYNTLKEDPGVAACKALRDQQSADNGGGDTNMSEAEYRQVRKLFADSRHDDIREHGTKLVDLLWQVQQLPQGNETAGIALLGQLTEHLTGLQSACADQGVVVNLLGGNNSEPGEIGVDPSAAPSLAAERIGAPFPYQEQFSDGSAPVDWQVTVTKVRCGIRLFKHAADNPDYTSGNWSVNDVPRNASMRNRRRGRSSAGWTRP